MYLPQHFAMPEGAARDLIVRANFGTLVTVDETGAPFATHLPFLFDAARGDKGTLIAHMARPNPQWRHFADGREVLAIFRGAHAYVSPTWYKTGPAVPTWNYEAVHAYGRPVLVDDPAKARDMVSRLSAHHENGRSPAWATGDVPDTFIANMVKAITAFEIPISRIIGKAKMSQNRPEADRIGVAEALEAEGQQVMAARMGKG